jgi:fibronectin type 3 domain-containing protein
VGDTFSDGTVTWMEVAEDDNCASDVFIAEVSASGSGALSAALNWNVSPGATSYNVYRANVSGGPYTQWNSSPITTSAWTDTSVEHGLTYYYVATAVAAGGESGSSNEAQAVIP